MRAIRKEIYECSECHKTYDTLEKAETCCTTKETISNEILDKMERLIKSTEYIENTDMYICALHVLDKLDYYERELNKIKLTYKGLESIKKQIRAKCKKFLDNKFAEIFNDLNNKYKDFFNKEFKIDNAIYKTYDSESFLEDYFKMTDDYFHEYNVDFVSRVYIRGGN